MVGSECVAWGIFVMRGHDNWGRGRPSPETSVFSFEEWVYLSRVVLVKGRAT